MLFLALCMLMHALPDPVLNTLGLISDHISDMSPEFIKGIEHVIFTMLLN